MVRKKLWQLTLGASSEVLVTKKIQKQPLSATEFRLLRSLLRHRWPTNKSILWRTGTTWQEIHPNLKIRTAALALERQGFVYAVDLPGFAPSAPGGFVRVYWLSDLGRALLVRAAKRTSNPNHRVIGMCNRLVCRLRDFFAWPTANA